MSATFVPAARRFMWDSPNAATGVRRCQLIEDGPVIYTRPASVNGRRR